MATLAWLRDAIVARLSSCTTSATSPISVAAGPRWSAVSSAGLASATAQRPRHRVVSLLDAAAEFQTSVGDLFHKDAPVRYLDHLAAVMAITPQHASQLLTNHGRGDLRTRQFLTVRTAVESQQVVSYGSGKTATIGCCARTHRSARQSTSGMNEHQPTPSPHTRPSWRVIWAVLKNPLYLVQHGRDVFPSEAEFVANLTLPVVLAVMLIDLGISAMLVRLLERERHIMIALLVTVATALTILAAVYVAICVKLVFSVNDNVKTRVKSIAVLLVSIVLIFANVYYEMELISEVAAYRDAPQVLYQLRYVTDASPTAAVPPAAAASGHTQSDRWFADRDAALHARQLLAGGSMTPVPDEIAVVLGSDSIRLKAAEERRTAFKGLDANMVRFRFVPTNTDAVAQPTAATDDAAFEAPLEFTLTPEVSLVSVLDSFVTLLYFSIVTAATVGFGDITPQLWYSRVAVSAQVVVTNAVVVIALGMALGRFFERRDREP